MKKLLISTLLLSFMATISFAQWIPIHSDQPVPAKKQLVSSNMESSVVTFTLDGFYMHKTETPRGLAYTVSVDEATPVLKKGAPDVAKLTTSVIIPDMENMQVEVVKAQYKTYENIEIAPSKGNLLRTVDPATVAYTYGKEYEQDAFYPATEAMARTPYILRDFRGQTLVVYPFRYNPVKKTLRVYYSMTVKLSATGTTGENILIRKKAFSKIDPEFKQVYQRQFLNYEVQTKYDPVEEDGGMLIICYSDFMDEMAPFVEWKTKTGRVVDLVDIAEVGSSSSAIKTYIANYYADNNLTYCLLVGDAQQVPTSYASGDSDNDYAYIEGSDSYPEIFMGRFSAETSDHVNTMVERSVDYEMSPYTDEDWFTNSISVASDQGPGDDGEYDYEHLRNIQADLNGFTYLYNYEYFDGSQGGNDATGNPSPTDVAVGLNSGATVVNYTGHGSTTSWGTSGFSNSHVNTLTNAGKLPFIWSVACVNGNFTGTTCFAEAWTRATDIDNNPTGAVAVLMSTINQSWNPPMQGQDDMNDIFTEQYADNIKRTFGGISFNGCMAMNDEYGSQGDEITDTWTLFGDPSLMVRSAMPEEISATHNPTIFLGSSFFTVNVTNAENATVALTMDGTIYGVATVEGGVATVNFAEPLVIPGDMDLVITGFNKLPYMTTLDVIPAEGPYVTMMAYDLNDETGNGNGEPDYNETVNLSVDLENIGVETAFDVVATLSTEDSYVTITDNSENAGTIADGELVTLTDAFAVEIAADVPDQHVAAFTVEITDGTDIWTSYLNLTINAPQLTSGNLTIDDAFGNGNGRLDPGETVTLSIPVNNEGQAAITDVTASLSTTSAYATITNTTFDVGDIAAGASSMATFELACDASTPIGTVIDLNFNAFSGAYDVAEAYAVTAGLILEDFETNDFSAFDWTFGGNADWQTVDDVVYEGTYSAQSGDIGDNQTSELIIDYDVMTTDSISFYRKVSSENNYDKLFFFIDGTQMGEWSGTENWQRVAYEVTGGLHQFKWVYDKDFTVSSGDDCAWIDYIVFPPEAVMTASAGPDKATCEDAACEINGYATLYDDLEWTTAGDGVFDDPYAMQPFYTPGIEDIINGEVTLTIQVTGGDETLQDDMLLTIHPQATVDAGTDLIACSNEGVEMNGVAENYSGLLWETSGTGIFDNPALTDAVYTPSAEDVSAGMVILTFTAMGLESCVDVADTITLTLNPLATVDAGADMEVCEGQTAQLEGVATDYSGLLWETSGTGTFDDTSMLNAVYSPSEEDVNTGQVTLTLTALGLEACDDVSSDLILTIHALPATPEQPSGDVSVCPGSEEVYIIPAAAYADSYEWILEPETAGTLVADGTELAVTWNDSFAGNAALAVTGYNNCGAGQSSDTLDILVNALVAGQFVSDIDTVDLAYNSTSAFILTEVENATAINWSLEPETAGTTTADGEFCEVSWDAAFTGIVTVKAELSNDCGNLMLEHTLEVISTVGMPGGSLVKARVYPNPNNGRFLLQLDVKHSAEVNITVVSPLGQSLFKQQDVEFNERYQTTIELGDAPKGMYYLIIESNDQRMVEKIVVK